MARTRILELRNVESAMSLRLPVVCPAGEPVVETLEGPTCHCRIENSVISVARDLSSYSVYCAGEHQLCPTWRAARELEWRHEDVARLTAPDAPERNFSMAEIEDMQERGEAGDADGVNRIRSAIAERRRAQGIRDVGSG